MPELDGHLCPGTKLRLVLSLPRLTVLTQPMLFEAGASNLLLTGVAGTLTSTLEKIGVRGTDLLGAAATQHQPHESET